MDGDVNTLGDEGENFRLTWMVLVFSVKKLYGDLLTGTKVGVEDCEQKRLEIANLKNVPGNNQEKNEKRFNNSSKSHSKSIK